MKYVLGIVILIALASCRHQPERKQEADTLNRAWDHTIPGNFSGQSRTVFDSLQLDMFFKTYPAFKINAGEIRRFYKGRNYAYAWFERGKLIEQAGNLASRVLDLPNERAGQSAPYTSQLDSLVNNPELRQPDIQAELMLTAQYFVLARMAWQGMDKAVSRAAHWYVPRKKVDYRQYLDSLLREPAKSTTLPVPVYRQYELLRTWLKKYRDLAKQDSWARIRLTRRFQPGDTAAEIPRIKERLAQLEDFHGDTVGNAFDQGLQAALRHFQARHGLNPDGLLTRETLAELNVPVKNRIEQLLVNMERNRWLPVRINSDYLAVNIPEFRLHVYHADSLLWSCNVVVGKALNRTTIFYGEVKYVVFSPYWDVPQSIVRKELLPEMRKHPGYLASHQMQITGYAQGLPLIRQLPGPENSLGLVKFLFPNSYNIYLHDTPSKSLFGEATRAFSHGCIRVQEPAKLAAFLLKDQPEWNEETIERAMHSGKEQQVSLAKKIPVFITYFTAFIDRGGQLNFRKDIYELDGKLAAMLLLPPAGPKRPR